jgi:hypothetical protein
LGLVDADRDRAWAAAQWWVGMIAHQGRRRQPISGTDHRVTPVKRTGGRPAAIALPCSGRDAFLRILRPPPIVVVVRMAGRTAHSVATAAQTAPEIGQASGIFNMFRFLGGVFGIAIVVVVFAATGGVDSPQAFSAGFAAAIGVTAALSLLGAVAGLWQPGRRVEAVGAARAKA